MFCFLDIHMPRLSGFDVLARLPSQPIVIFTTAYDRYALRAFAVNSVDYLVKPVDPAHLERSLTKVENLRRADPPALTDIGTLLARFTETLTRVKPNYPERIAVRLGTRLWFLDLPKTN